ncbi:MAG: SDR family NAD(P)-dependent oxidoreductase [Planctomycetota bacterium]|nr:SDR family NAD(P)-dependent oxidoreductase [Planctomycetota bacterium]
MGSMRGKTVYLTGATRGIGRAIAERLAGESLRLAICGRDAAAMQRVAEAIRARTTEPLYSAVFDLAHEDAIRTFCRDARSAVGPPDVLVNNAGYNSRKAPLSDVGTEEFDSIVAVNLRAPFIFMREVYGDMKERGGGHIVNVLSTVCHASMETMGAYTAAKAGLRALTDVFRKEVLPDAIRVTSVYPGGTNTAFRPEAREDYMRPESVAEAVWAALTLPEDLVVHELTFRPMVESNF